MRRYPVIPFQINKLPRSIVVVDALPLTAIGKIDKKLLAARQVP